MPDNAPRKWMFCNITAIRENTGGILALLEPVQPEPAQQVRPLVPDLGDVRPYSAERRRLLLKAFGAGLTWSHRTTASSPAGGGMWADNLRVLVVAVAPASWPVTRSPACWASLGRWHGAQRTPPVA